MSTDDLYCKTCGRRLVLKGGGIGKNNHRWKGGISKYTNHYRMKLARLEKFKLSKGKCEICNKKANIIHHIDESTINHKLENLMILCFACHKIIHRRVVV